MGGDGRKGDGEKWRGWRRGDWLQEISSYIGQSAVLATLIHTNILHYSYTINDYK